MSLFVLGAHMARTTTKKFPKQLNMNEHKNLIISFMQMYLRSNAY